MHGWPRKSSEKTYIQKLEAPHFLFAQKQSNMHRQIPNRKVPEERPCLLAIHLHMCLALEDASFCQACMP